MPTFSDKYIKGLPAKSAPYRVAEGGADKGFCVQVTPAGGKIFEVQYYLQGKRRFYRIGAYPALSLAEARVKARDVRGQLERGEDPKARARPTTRAGTVEELAEHYVDRLKSSGKASWGEVQRAFKNDVLPLIGDKPAADVSPADVRDLLYAAIQRGAPTYANRLRSYLHAAFRAGIRHDNDPRAMGSALRFNIARNPAEDVPSNPDAEKALDRALSWDEIKLVWDAPELSTVQRLAIRLILATGGQRPGEVVGAPVEEFDFDGRVWELRRTKNGRLHLIPLSDMALEIISELRGIFPNSRWLFPARNSASAKSPWHETSMSHIVKKYCDAAGVTPWTPRDLRRTVKTRMGEIGVSLQIRNHLQNHALQGDVATKHYDRYDYMNEKRQAMELWCAKLHDVVSEKVEE